MGTEMQRKGDRWQHGFLDIGVQMTAQDTAWSLLT
jgi:hypothetical protein